MDRIRLSRQLIIVFTLVIVSSMFIFIILANISLSAIYDQVNIDRLNQYITSTKSSWMEGRETKAGNIEYLIYDARENRLITSPRLNSTTISDLDGLSLESIEKNIIINRSIYINHIKVHYAMEIADNGTFIIAILDENYTSGLKKVALGQMILIFSAILVIGNMVIALWSRNVVHRLSKIKKDIIDLPKNNYTNKIPYYGDDEIGDLALSIEDMRKEIEQNEKSKQEMLQNVSHDFKTPIAVIKSYAEAILDGIEGKEGAKVIIKQSDILKKKTYQLLTFNKLEYLEGNKDFESVNMKTLIENVLTNYRFQTEIEFITDLDDVYFMGFAENYSTVVENILDNGIRYAKTKIEIILKNNELIISNDGPQIDEKFMNDIFKPYEKSNKGQFGLGMSIVQRTLAFFNMNIEVKNLANGVSFRIKKSL